MSSVERSSGSRQYRRLDRGGDRQANAALHRIVFTRLRVDPCTQAYTNAAPRRARPDVRSSDASSDMPPARSSTWSGRYPPNPSHRASAIRERV
ncbi:transposase [Streptomyces sp. TP-A0356]|uniref:transposase n=1 Tax=Streptomyces sp. TP-A0356 TaxID=1359208 RepID=UPI00352A5CEB